MQDQLDQETLAQIEELPEKIRARAKEVAEAILLGKGSMSKLEQLHALKKLNEDYEEASYAEFDKKKPIRSIKLTPKLVKRVKEDDKWTKEMKKKADELGEAELKVKAKYKELIQEIAERKEDLKAAISVEMGISSLTHEFRVNSETMELEIITDDTKKK